MKPNSFYPINYFQTPCDTFFSTDSSSVKIPFRPEEEIEVFATKNSEVCDEALDAFILKEPRIDYSVDLDVKLGDNINNLLVKSTPEEAFHMMPEKYVKLGDSRLYCHTDNIEAYNNLPRTATGEIDIEKVKESLEKATVMIKEQNELALAEIDYGAYKKAINSTDLLTAFLGPEGAHIVKNSGVELPNFLLKDVSIIDSIDGLNEFIIECAVIANKPIEDFLPSEDLHDLIGVKSSGKIESNIKKQNDALDRLANFDLQSEEDVKEFLDFYLQITGTTFSCDRIDGCYSKQNDSNCDAQEKMISYAESCGLSTNYVDAQKNAILTNVIFNVGLNYIVPSILYKVKHPVVQGIALLLPTYIPAAEMATKGCDDGEILNLSNFTYDSTIDLLADGALTAFLVALPSSKFGENIFKNCNFMKNIFTPEKGTFWNKTLTKLGVSKPMKVVGNLSAKKVLKETFKFVLPDISTKTGVYKALSPTYNTFATVKSWL